MKKNIPFNVPHVTAQDEKYILEALRSRNIIGDGPYAKKCHGYFEQKYQCKKALMTGSCTDALEMCAVLLNLQEGDEVIMPSYTFVSTANAFVLHGAKIRFADSLPHHPNVDVNEIKKLINPKTKAIVVVHYAGHACDMDAILALAKEHSIPLIEDAAQGIFSYYNKKPLGTIGNLGTLSFHATKNIVAGEGGMLFVNDEKFQKRAEIIREKGTNRSAFFRGEVDKYTWVDVGSSYLASDLQAALLLGQLERSDQIQDRRLQIYSRYQEEFFCLTKKNIMLPQRPPGATDNAHLFFLVCNDLAERTALAQHLKDNGIQSSFHYVALHSSPFHKPVHDGRQLPQADRYTDCLIRFPLYPDLSTDDIARITQTTKEFFQ